MGIFKGPKIVAATSKLAELSRVAELAANTGRIVVKDYHLASSLLKSKAKFSAAVNAFDVVAEALKSKNAAFLLNKGPDGVTVIPGWVMVVDLGRVVGTKGQTAVKIVFNAAGEMITSYPYKPLAPWVP